MKKIIHTTNAPKAIGPYSQAVKFNSLLFVSGQIPLNLESGQIELSDTLEQTRLVFSHIEAILASEGLNLGHIIKIELYMSNMNDFGVINEEYGRIFEKYTEKPARQAMEVSALPKGAKVEISCIAGYEK